MIYIYCLAYSSHLYDLATFGDDDVELFISGVIFEVDPLCEVDGSMSSV